MLLRILYLALPFALLFGCSKTPGTTVAEPQQVAIPQSTDVVESATSDTTNAVAPETVAERIHSAIAMLEAKKHKEFLESFFVPEELKAAKDSGDYDDVVENFSSRNAPELLDALRSIRGTEPTMSDDQKTAWFTIEVRIASQNTLAFVNVDGSWFIPNKPPKK
ncbi:MAG: hypothetical protein WBD31_02950 [Rubripirellula sp.]